MLAWHFFVDMIGGETIDRAVAPEDHENGHWDDDGNRQGFQIETQNDEGHGGPQEKESPFQAWRRKVDCNSSTDGIPQENEDVGDCEELTPLHGRFCALRVEERHQGRVEHVENGWPVFHGKVAEELSPEEGCHPGHPLASLSQGDGKVRSLQLRVATRGIEEEDAQAHWQACRNVPIEGDNGKAEGTQGESLRKRENDPSWCSKLLCQAQY